MAYGARDLDFFQRDGDFVIFPVSDHRGSVSALAGDQDPLARQRVDAQLCQRYFSIAMCSMPASMKIRPRGRYPDVSYSARA